MAMGLVTLGGFSLGVWAIGGFALGWKAFGGCAVASSAAQGGVAIAHHFAQGGAAMAVHANDAAANAFFQNSRFFQIAQLAMQHAQWLNLLYLLPVGFWIWAQRKKKRWRSSQIF